MVAAPAVPRWAQSLGKMVGMDFFHLFLAQVTVTLSPLENIKC